MINLVEKIAITETSYPFTSAKRYGYLDASNYEELEYYMHGTANVYQTEADGSIGIRSGDAPYVNRFIVRKPTDVAHFSGNVVVEIINPSSNMDLERMWVLSHRQLLRSGDIYVGITSKPNTIRALQLFDADRYAKIDWSNPTKDQPFPFTQDDLRAYPTVTCDQDIKYETGLFWDMLTDLAVLLRSREDNNPIRDFHPKTIVLTGWSQSACYLVRYLNEFAYMGREHSVYDGFLAAGPPRYFPAPINQYESVSCAVNDCVQVKSVKEPCIILQTESENAQFGAHDTVRNDGDEQDFMCRHFDVTGASHDTLYSLIDYYQHDADLDRIGFQFSYVGQNEEANNYPTEIVVGAMFRNLFYWIHSGVAPRPCERIQVSSKGENIKDALGISVGGIRTCLLDYPTGSFYHYSDVNSGHNTIFQNAGKNHLFGHEDPFPAEMLCQMYGSLSHYQELVTRHTLRQIMNGYIVKEDADALIDAAVSRAKRRGLR